MLKSIYAADQLTTMIYVTYENLCPSCGLSFSETEILSSTCHRTKKNLCFREIDHTLEAFTEFFEKTVGKIRSIQKFWAARVFEGESFTAVAPTGIGKTTFGILISIFLSKKGLKSYLIFPTTVLVDQTIEKILNFCKKAEISLSLNKNDGELVVGYYHNNLKKKEKEDFFRILESKSYTILVTTTAFLSKNFEKIDTFFDFVFVDDVDAILKNSKNVDRILNLLGFQKHGENWSGVPKGVLMVSTATATPGKKARLFRDLLGFDIGTTTHAVRNIEDVFIQDSSLDCLKGILKKMGSGGLIYTETFEKSVEVFTALNEEFRIGLASGRSKKDIERFETGELEYLVGTSHYYGTIVRGLDMPERIRYVVFLKAPVFKIRFQDVEKLKPRILRTLALIFRDDEKIKRYLPYLNRLSNRQLNEIREVIKKKIEYGDFEYQRKDVVVRKGEIIFPDVKTYIQGSGRTSRLYVGGITKGASFLLEDDEEILNAFIERAKLSDIVFKSFDEVELSTLIYEIDTTRKKLRKRDYEVDLVKPTLFIVESPTKARQIARFFGKPSLKVLKDGEGVLIAYEVPTGDRILIVTASLGHVVDLITDREFYGVEVKNGTIRPIYGSIKKCKTCNHQFTDEVSRCPKCGETALDNSKTRIKLMRRLAKETGFVVIGTDPDAEGEKIAWDLANLLRGCGNVRRAEFHEVTKKAVIEALNNLREIDENLVKAQIVRRIEDRWIGFELSHKLWSYFHNKNLSAGRAQTPVLGWVVKRAEKSRKKRKVGYIRELDLYIDEIDKSDVEIGIELMERTVKNQPPLPPYTTDSMLRDANGILKMSTKDAMSLAQDLFESGLITYHRTDATTVSDLGLRIAKEYLGDDFEGRRWEKEGAHECIRPTRPLEKYDIQRLIEEEVIHVEGITWRHLALYDLIFRRFMASQAKDYSITVKRYLIRIDGRTLEEERITDASGRGYELYRSVRVKKDLPEGKFKFKPKILKIPEEPLLSQSELISLMKERGIGRPSTYSTIVEKLFARKYVIERNGKMIPTDMGKKVFNYLVTNYGEFVSEERTRILQDKMDKIEKGQTDYLEALRELYQEIRSIP